MAEITAVANVSAPSAQNLSRLCKSCGSRGLQLRPQSFIGRILPVASYACVRCGGGTTRFRFSFSALVILILLLISIGEGAYLYLLLRPGGIRDSPTVTGATLERARTNGLSAFEQMMLKKPRSTMDNVTVLQLCSANVGTDLILQMIRNSNPDFDVDAVAVIELKKAGVDERIIAAMIDAPYNSR
jgi:hypothetical protein